MDDLAHLTTVINTILASDNNNRKESEALLQKIRENDLDNYIILFCNLLSTSQSPEVRMFCIAHLRRQLSNYVSSVDTSVWHFLRPETQIFVKEAMFPILRQEQHKKAASLLSDFIGELGATMKTLKDDIKAVCPKEGLQWNELMQLVWGLLTSNTELLIQSALQIMGILFTYCESEFAQFKDELVPLFKQTLEHESLKIRAVSIEALASFLKNVESKDCKAMVDLIPLVLQNVLIIIDKDEDLAIDVLGDLEEVIEVEAKIFKKYLREFFETIKTINQKKLTIPGLKDTGLKILTMLAQRSPSFYQNNSSLLKELFEEYFRRMISSAEEPDEEWSRPPEGFVENDDNAGTSDTTITFCMSMIDQVIEVLEEELTLPLLSGLVMEMVKVNDWRYQYAALMALSQVGEYIDDIEEIDPIMKIILQFLESPHPKVRYAAIHCIGQLAADMKGDFARRYHANLIPLLLNVLNDNVPRIVGHNLAALTNVLESCSTEAVKPHLAGVLEPCLGFLASGISLVKENALTSISTIAKVAGRAFIPYWQKTAEIVFTVLNSSTQKEHKYLRGHCIECLTLVGLAVGEEEFQKAVHEVITKMIEIQQNDIDAADPQKFFLLAGWKRICILLKSRFAPYLETILPSLFNVIDSIVDEEKEKKRKLTQAEDEATDVREAMGVLPNDEKKDKLFYATNTTESQEVVLCVDMIHTFLKHLGKDYLPYIQKTSEVLVFLIKNSSNDKVRFACAQGLAEIILVIQASDEPDKQALAATSARTYEALLWRAIAEEFEAVNISKFIYGIKDIVTAGGRYMTEEEITDFTEKVIEALRKSDNRKNENKTYVAANKDDFDEDDHYYMEEENKNEEELQCALADLMGALFVSHKDMTLNLVQYIQKELLPKVFDESVSYIMNKFGIFLIDNMIEFLGIELIPENWPYFTEILIQYSTHHRPELRQAAVYGLGVLAEKSKEKFPLVSEACLKALYASIQLKKDTTRKDDYFYARDNAVSALGKIIKCQSHNINLKETIQFWLSQLPLKHDKLEAKLQHELLVDIILESDANLIFGEKGENLARVLQIFAEVVETKLASERFREKVGKVIQLLGGNEATRPMLQEAINKIDKKWQDKLQKVVENK